MGMCDVLPGECEVCCTDLLTDLGMEIPPVVLQDVTGRFWCTEHRMHGDFITIMSARGYPALVTETDTQEPNDDTIHRRICYRIEAGVWFTLQVALTSSDECITFLALAALDIEDEEIDDIPLWDMPESEQEA